MNFIKKLNFWKSMSKIKRGIREKVLLNKNKNPNINPYNYNYNSFFLLSTNSLIFSLFLVNSDYELSAESDLIKVLLYRP